MRRATWLSTGLAIVLAVLSGCGPEKELPRNVPNPPDREATADPPVPATSHPDAVKLIEKCVRAATDGHPERAAKAKSNTQTVTGMMSLGGPQPVKTTRQIRAVWPDRIRADYEFASGDIRRIMLGVRRPRVWTVNVTDAGPKDFPAANPQEYADIVTFDATGTHWLPLLFPLSEPGAVLFDSRTDTTANPPAEVVKFALKGQPVYALAFDATTNLIRSVSYTHPELGTRIAKHVEFGGHKPVGGVQLPTQIEFRRNAVVVEQWTVTGWEFVDRVEDKWFDEPADAKK